MEIRIDAEGRLVLPAELVQELGWTPGTVLEVERAGRELRVRQGSGAGGQGSASVTPPTGLQTRPPSAYGAATPAGVDMASLKEEARQLADAMRNVGRTDAIEHEDTKTRRDTDTQIDIEAGARASRTTSPGTRSP